MYNNMSQSHVQLHVHVPFADACFSKFGSDFSHLLRAFENVGFQKMCFPLGKIKFLGGNVLKTLALHYSPPTADRSQGKPCRECFGLVLRRNAFFFDVLLQLIFQVPSERHFSKKPSEMAPK